MAIVGIVIQPAMMTDCEIFIARALQDVAARPARSAELRFGLHFELTCPEIKTL